MLVLFSWPPSTPAATRLAGLLWAAARVFPRTTRQLYCTFDLAVLPARGPARVLSTAWRVPGGTLERVSKPRTRRVLGVVARSGSSFPSGRYACTLRSGGTVVGTVGARIR